MSIFHKNYLRDHGFDYRTVETPRIWTHLEESFARRSGLGSRFTSLPVRKVRQIIRYGERAALHALVHAHQQGQSLSHVTISLNLPFPVGSERRVVETNSDTRTQLSLIANPGTPSERLVTVRLVSESDIPLTHSLSVNSGLFADGLSLGLHSISPGEPLVGYDNILLVTAEDIRRALSDMRAQIDEIAVVNAETCLELISRAEKALANH